MKGSVAGVVVAMILGTLAACTDAATAPEFRVASFSAAVNGGDPPPPPAEGESTDIFGFQCLTGQLPPGTVVFCLLEIVAPVSVRGLVNPHQNAGFVQFSSTDPRVLISERAIVRKTGPDSRGTGTIEIPPDLIVDEPWLSNTVVVDLSRASLDFGTISVGGQLKKIAEVSAPAAYANGDPIMQVTESGVIISYPRAVLGFVFP